jgi:hypothetical protein
MDQKQCGYSDRRASPWKVVMPRTLPLLPATFLLVTAIAASVSARGELCRLETAAGGLY